MNAAIVATGDPMTVALALIYTSAITFVSAFLFFAVDWLEPNPRLSLVFKCALLAAGGVAIMTQLLRPASGMAP